jgi:hypothetical protein
MKTRRTLVGIAALCIALLGCSKKGVDDNKAGASRAGSGETSASLTKLLGVIPWDALLVGVLDSTKPLWDFITGDFVLPMLPKHREALEKELRAYLDARLGVDLFKSKAAAVFVHGTEPKGAILIGDVSGTLKGEKAGDHGGIDLVVIDADVEAVAAIKDGTLIIGIKPSVEKVLDVMAGQGE